MKRSRQHKRDPTGSQRKINVYERALTGLFQNYKRRVVADLEHENARALEAPAQKPVKVDLGTFSQHLDQVEQEELLKPSERTIEVKIPEAYKAGNAFASIQLGASLEIRRDEWKKLAVRVEKVKTDFKGISDEVNNRIKSIIGDGIINEKSFSEISRDIVRNVEGVGIVKATRNARSDIMEAVNAGVHERYATAGITEEEEFWLAAIDDDTCDECLDNDGKSIAEIGYYPPEHNGVPYGCRCTIIVQVKIPAMGGH